MNDSFARLWSRKAEDGLRHLALAVFDFDAANPTWGTECGKTFEGNAGAHRGDALACDACHQTAYGRPAPVDAYEAAKRIADQLRAARASRPWRVDPIVVSALTADVLTPSRLEQMKKSLLAGASRGTRDGFADDLRAAVDDDLEFEPYVV